MSEGKGVLKVWERNSVSTKMILIGILALLLLIPAGMAGRLIDEREHRQNQVSREIGNKWGLEQTVTGPVLAVPYLEKGVNSKGREIVVGRKTLYLLPESLDINAEVTPAARYRGIYEAVVYTSQLRLSGGFDLSLLQQSGIPGGNLLLDEATILLAMSDMRGIREQIGATVNGRALELNPGVQGPLGGSSVGSPIPSLRGLKTLTYDFNLDLNGNGQLQFIPLGKTTHLTMTSPWATPSFDGSFLPVERKVDAGGFAAQWKILHFNRDLPQFWSDHRLDCDKYAFGVSFLIPADIYQQTTRSAKYAILFIGFTFSAFFIAEILTRKRVHPVQYLLIGLALVLFYVLLLSLSEHLAFGLAYLLATLATIALVACYSASVLRTRRLGALVAALLGGLYGYMYVLLNLEDYALLMGGIGLFLVLGAIMYLTRGIDWYAGAAAATE